MLSALPRTRDRRAWSVTAEAVATEWRATMAKTNAKAKSQQNGNEKSRTKAGTSAMPRINPRPRVHAEHIGRARAGGAAKGRGRTSPDSNAGGHQPDAIAPAIRSAGTHSASSGVEPLPARRHPRPHTKQAIVIGLLLRRDGASLSALMETTGWLAHTTRAMLTGLRKKGYDLVRTRSGDKITRYRIERLPTGLEEGAAAQRPAAAGSAL